MLKLKDYVQHALYKVSIAFRKNKFVSILGESGSEKTTILNIIVGKNYYDSYRVNGFEYKIFNEHYRFPCHVNKEPLTKRFVEVF